MHMTKIVLLLGSLSLMTHSAVAAKIPKFGGYSKTSTTQMVNKSKTKSNQQKVKKHNGYKVIDKHGNVSYVDNITKPKKQVSLISINGEAPTQKQLKNIESHIEINKLNF